MTMAKYTITGLPKKKKFEDGGFVEIDIPNEAIQDYINRGYIVEEVDEYSNGGIFRRRRQEPSPDYTAWSGTTPQLVQPGEDPFALPTNTPLPAAEFKQPEFMFPDWTPEQIDAYYREKEAYDARMARKNAYTPATLTYKDLARPQSYFVLAEDMSQDFLKELKNNGFYAKKTDSGDYEVFSNKDIADLIYKKGLNPNELSTKLDLGSAKELKSYFDPIYQNASMIHAKRNKEKIDRLIKQGYDKDAAIAKLVRDGEGTATELNKLYGTYTKAAYDKKQAEAKALLAAGAADPDKLTDYQKQMYLNIQNFADKSYQEKVGAANEQVSSWGKWDIQPAESTAIRNKAGYTDPMTGEYQQADNSTAWERNESAKATALSELADYNATTALQAQAAKEILESNQLTDEQRKKFLENPDEFNKILKEYVDYSRASEGELDFRSPQMSGEYRYTPGYLKSDFNVTPEGAQWTPGAYGRGRYIDGPVEMLYPEKYLIGPGAGVLGAGFRGLTRALEYAPISAAPWLTAGNTLNAYMGYETVKPGGLISQSIEGFKEGDKLKGWGNAGMSALNLMPFVGPTMKGMEYLNALGKVDNAGQFERVTQAGIGNWFKPSQSVNSIIDDVTLKTLKSNNYQGASDELLTKIIQKKKGEMQKGTWSSQMTPDEELVLAANKDRVNQLIGNVEVPTIPPPAAPTGFLGKTYNKGKNLITGTAGKIGTGTSNTAKNWWNARKTDMANASWLERFAPLRPTSSVGTTTTSTAATAAQNTTKYQTIDEIAQAMYGSNYDDLASSLAKAQVDKAFKAQPLPSGASTSGQGAASTVTSVSDDIILKNKIANEKYGVDYDKLTGWAPSVVDKEFQTAKTLQQEAAATNQAKNTAEANTGVTLENSSVEFNASTPRFDFERHGEALQGLRQRGKYWDETGAKGEELLNSDMLKYHGTYSGRPIVEVKMPDGSSEFFYKSSGWASKKGTGVDGTTEGMWQPFGGFSNTPTTKNWFIKDKGYENFYGSNTFKSMAENLDDALKKKFDLKTTDELNNAFNFKNKNSGVDSFTPMSIGIGTAGSMAADDENNNMMLASLPLAFMTKGKVKLSPDKLKYLKLATTAASDASPLKTSSIFSTESNNITNFMVFPAINKGLTGSAQQTEGAFNKGVFNLKYDPEYVIKMEDPIKVGFFRGMPGYKNVDMAEKMQNISGPTFGKVHKQFNNVDGDPGTRGLVLNKLEGTPYNEITMDDYLNLGDDAIVKFHDDIQTLKRNNLAFDFEGNNYIFDRNTQQFKLFDIDPHTTVYDPNNMLAFDDFQNLVYGGGNPMLFGSKQAGLNLQNALKRRFARDLMFKMNKAGVSDTDMRGINHVYQQRLNHLFKGLNYEKDGGFIEIDIPEEAIREYTARGYNVEEIDDYTKKGFIDKEVKVPAMQSGGTPSQLWYQYTGTPWSEAKAKGLTDGSMEQNLALVKRLQAGEFGEPKLSNEQYQNIRSGYDQMVKKMVGQGKTLDQLVQQRVGTREGLKARFPELFKTQSTSNTKTPPVKSQAQKDAELKAARDWLTGKVKEIGSDIFDAIGDSYWGKLAKKAGSATVKYLEAEAAKDKAAKAKQAQKVKAVEKKVEKKVENTVKKVVNPIPDKSKKLPIVSEQRPQKTPAVLDILNQKSIFDFYTLENLKKFTKPIEKKKETPMTTYDIKGIVDQIQKGQKMGPPPSLTRQQSQQPLGDNSMAAQFARNNPTERINQINAQKKALGMKDLDLSQVKEKSIWDKAGEWGSELWDDTKEVASETWEGTKDLAEEYIADPLNRAIFNRDDFPDSFDEAAEGFVETPFGGWVAKKVYDTELLPDKYQDELKRKLQKQGEVKIEDDKVKEDPKKAIKKVEVKPKVDKFYEQVGTAPGGNTELLSYRNQFDNDEGFVYIATKLNRDRRSDEDYDDVYGVGHFLLDASANFDKPYSHEYSQAMIKKAKENNEYIPAFSNEGNGKVRLKYKKPNEITKTDLVVAPLRQWKFSNIDFNSSQSATSLGYSPKAGIKELTAKDGQGAKITFSAKDSYGRHSGASVVFIFKDKYGNTIVRDFAGSVGQIEREGNSIIQSYGIKPEDLTLGIHDVASYGAKPKADSSGKLKGNVWMNWNNSNITGGALLIPRTQSSLGSDKRYAASVKPKSPLK